MVGDGGKPLADPGNLLTNVKWKVSYWISVEQTPYAHLYPACAIAAKYERLGEGT
jgi:hypothetical protein